MAAPFRYAILVLMGLASCSVGRKMSLHKAGDINQYGFFQFHNREKYLQYLDFVSKKEIKGVTYFYLETFNESSECYIPLVGTNNELTPALIGRNRYTDLRKPISSKHLPYYQRLKINDSVFSAMKDLSLDYVVKTFVDTNGVLHNVENEHVKKMVVYKLVKENIMIAEDDVSGSPLLRKVYIVFDN